MAWKNIRQASYKGVPFKFFWVEDEISRALVRHEYPHRPGADLEDQGRHPRVCTLPVVFFREDYPDGMNALLTAIEEDGSGEFIHPVFGAWHANVEAGRLRHVGDIHNYATMSLTFVEDSTEPAEFAVEVGTPTTIVSQATDLRSDGEGHVLDSLESTITDTQGAVSTLLKIKTALNKTADVLHDVLRTVSNGAMSLSRTVENFVVNPTLWGAEISNTLSLVGEAIEDVIEAPGHFVDNLCRALDDAESTFIEEFNIPQTIIDAYELGEGEYTGGNTNLEVFTLAKEENTLAALELTTIWIKENADDLDPDDIDAMVTQARSRAQKTIEISRIMRGIDGARIYEVLGALAGAVLDVAERVKIEKPPIVVYEAPGDLPALVIAHTLYSDYTRVHEILKLNPWIRNPNDVPRGSELKVYAA